LFENPLADMSIEQYEHHEYELWVLIVITHGKLEVRDIWLMKVDGTANANAENVAFTNNVLMDLFTSTKYQISDQVTDFLFYSDQGTIMLGLL